MSVAFFEKCSLSEAIRPAAASGQVVLSRLPRGETIVRRSNLSLKVVLRGEERYVIDGRTTRLTPGQALLVDAGESSRVILPGREPTLGLCFYFPRVGLDPQSERLDLAPAPVPIVDHPLGPWLRSVADSLDGNPNLGTHSAEVLLHRTLEHLEDFVAGTKDRSGRIDAAKSSKRVELLRRVELARDFLHGTPDRIVTLEELADVAGLSAFHLARCFRAVHSEPPATYHRNLRLDRAAAELKQDGRAAAELPARYGFADQASFTRAFSRRFGTSPARYRACGPIR